jgi:hypothetical protein
MHRGYIKLWRKSIESPLWQNQTVWRLFEWCLLKASYTDHIQIVGYQQVTLKPGELIFGRKKAALETGLTEQNIRTALSVLQLTNTLTIKVTNKYSIIQIQKWEIYQDANHQSNQQNVTPVTNNQPATNQQLTTNKKDKKDKKDKNNIYMVQFEEFWKLYPRKVNKAKAQKAFLGLKPTEKLFKTIMASLDKAKESREWVKEEGQYIPHPTTWLNGKRWEDEIDSGRGYSKHDQVDRSRVRLAPKRSGPGQ